jgi:enediyne biosynthesis protein E3
MRTAWFGMKPGAVDLVAQGFPPPPASASTAFDTLQTHARSFADGYNAAVSSDGPPDFLRRLGQAPLGRTGFWVEGAAMSSTVLDALSARPRRLRLLLSSAGTAHSYLIHVGVGWAAARLHALRPSTKRTLDPLLKWLVWDGLGFARGFFAPQRHLLQRTPPWARDGYVARVADQGLGRCVWFYAWAQPDQACELVEAFPAARQADLWSGVGLAATYAGGAPAATLGPLLERAAPFRAHLAQGAVFGATARCSADELLPDTTEISQVLCGLSPSDAARLADEARRDSHQGTADDYERWRRSIREAVTTAVGFP